MFNFKGSSVFAGKGLPSVRGEGPVTSSLQYDSTREESTLVDHTRRQTYFHIFETTTFSCFFGQLLVLLSVLFFFFILWSK